MGGWYPRKRHVRLFIRHKFLICFVDGVGIERNVMKQRPQHIIRKAVIIQIR